MRQSRPLRHVAYRNKERDFGKGLVMSVAQEMHAYQWWAEHGGDWLDLQTVPVKVLAMVSGAGACERNWSANNFIHSKKRNSVTTERANDVVYVFTNMRLEKRP